MLFSFRRVALVRPRISALFASVLLLSLAISSLASPQAASAAITNNYYVPSTGHTFSDPFLTQWAQIDGREILGLPVSEVLTTDENRTQYFEYGALTGSNDDAIRPAELKVVETGRELLSARHDPTHLVAGRRIGGDGDRSLHEANRTLECKSSIRCRHRPPDFRPNPRPLQEARRRSSLWEATFGRL